ncbi:NAD(P)-dependent oxidoreductase [Saccharothrix sp. NPDC042600]|uniref:NAD(P)-dependent oxidoreductase n=1 Tax=Saccharothrix TaxID=2071 RepID=UPI00340688B1
MTWDRPEVLVAHSKMWPELVPRIAAEIEVRQSDTIADLDPAVRAGVEVLVGYQFPPGCLDLLPNLRWLHLTGTGTDHLAAAGLRPGTLVTNAARVPVEAVAEYAVAGLFMLLKDLAQLTENFSVVGTGANHALRGDADPGDVTGRANGTTGATGADDTTGTTRQAGAGDTAGTTRQAGAGGATGDARQAGAADTAGTTGQAGAGVTAGDARQAGAGDTAGTTRQAGAGVTAGATGQAGGGDSAGDVGRAAGTASGAGAAGQISHTAGTAADASCAAGTAGEAGGSGPAGGAVRAMGARPAWYTGRAVMLDGATVLVLGGGRIGRAVVRRLSALGARCIAVTRSGRNQVPLAVKTVGVAALPAIANEVDHVVGCLPATDQPLVDKAVLAALPSHAALVNVGRASTVDEEALYEALRSKRIRGAFLDVHRTEPLPDDDPAWSVPNLVVSPHRAFAFPGEPAEVARTFLDNLADLRAGRTPRDAVNLGEEQ